MCSGAVALDGRIEPGDMILEVNGISFENLSNDEAVRILRDVVQKSGLANVKSLSVITRYVMGDSAKYEPDDPNFKVLLLTKIILIINRSMFLLHLLQIWL